MPEKPRILFFCQLNPWRLTNGGSIRNYWLLHALTEHFAVDLVTADDPSEPIPADFRARCAGIYRFPERRGRRAKLIKALRALRPRSSYFTSGVVTPGMKAAVAAMVAAHPYHAILIELAFIDAVPRGDLPLVYASHNCETALLARRARLEPLWLRIIMTIDAWRLGRVEARVVKRARLVTVCSDNDVQDLLALAPTIAAKSAVIPNGVDCATYAAVAANAPAGKTLLVTGSFDWPPNRRGLEWFLTDVLPLLEPKLAGKQCTIRIAGRMDANLIKHVRTFPGVTAAPNVPRMDVELAGAAVVLVPVIASSGTRLRILEAWAAGRPVVTTPHGAFGLSYIDGSDLCSCATAEAFADTVARLVDDDVLREKLRAGGLARAASYDWTRINERFIGALSSAIAETSSP
jgi:glycosyltransferase involved in cell wall biosynthesis